MKVAVVTGAAKGLGKAFALALAAAGYTVVVHYHKSKKEAEAVIDVIRKKSPESFAISADLKDEKQAEVMFVEIVKILGRVDLLINNVGNFLYKDFSQTTSEEFRDILESNVYSTFFCTRAVLPTMRKQKDGHVITIGCVGCDSVTVREKSAPYFMAKSGVYYLTKAFALEEAQYGVHVNMISPASMATDIFKPDDFPMGRAVNYTDVVNVLLFLLSKRAYYINGANIEVAGGFIPGVKK